MKFWKFSILIFCLYAPEALSQKSNDRCKWVSQINIPFKLDTLSIIPGTIVVSDSLSVDIDYNFSDGMVELNSRDQIDSIKVCYRVFPYDFHVEIKNKEYNENDSGKAGQDTLHEEKQFLTEKEELFPTENIYKSGMISRGISFGNRQDIFVNSVLNLQMEGKLSDQLNIRASITDQNIPYQPEGNTKLVQDFDNVFFEIYNQDLSLKGGDLVLKNKKSDFLNFNRNIQGVGINSKYQLFNGYGSESSVTLSVTKGKFASSRLDVIDGVMGPYKIYGPQNESFIIIIANSEKVFVDGRLLERGFNNDYIIDYNTAEITFTSNVLITKFSRVNIDFEYTNQSFSRSVLNVSHSQSIKDVDITVQFYQEKDNRNQPLAFDLSPDDKWILSQVDPDIYQAGFLPGWDSVENTPNRILYKKIDTTNLQGNPVEIFQYSTNPDSAVYQVSFTKVEGGKGSYIKKEAGINGYYYQWVGEGRGDFLPLKTVPLPSYERMLSVRSTYRLNKESLIFSEIAFSSHDENLFNKYASGKNGFAIKSGILTEEKKIDLLPGYFFSGQVDFEFDDEYFQGIDRFREVEYNRDWSYSHKYDSMHASDKIIHASAALQKDHNNYLKSKTSRRIRSGTINGWQEHFDGSFDLERFRLTGSLFLMNNDNVYFSSDWIRYELQTYFKSKYFYPGYRFRVDNNEIKSIDSDSVISSAMNYEEHTFFIRNNDSLKSTFNLNYNIRKDRLPEFGEMRDHYHSRTANLIIGPSPGRWGKMDLTMTYRQLEFLNDTINNDQHSLMGRVNWFVNFLDKHLSSDLFYAIGNSRELKREYIFFPVPTGQGTHTWRDDNQDEIQDLNEFYPAINPDEKNFIKLFTPTDEYVLAYDNNLNYRFSAEMPRRWRSQQGLKKIIGRFSNILTVNFRQKINQANFWDNMLFKGSGLDNNHLISYRENIRNVLYFNRADPGYSMELIYHQSNYKQLISSGFEGRNKSSLEWVSRMNINRDYALNLSLGKSEITSRSDFLKGRSYVIDNREISTGITWQPTQYWRLASTYSINNKFEIESEEKNNNRAMTNKAELNFRFSKAMAKNLDFTLRYYNIDFSGTENSALGYALLEGLKPGNNFTWSLAWQQKLFSGLQMNINYEGRKSGDIKTIHIGRMQIMAIF